MVFRIASRASLSFLRKWSAARCLYTSSRTPHSFLITTSLLARFSVGSAFDGPAAGCDAAPWGGAPLPDGWDAGPCWGAIAAETRRKERATRGAFDMEVSAGTCVGFGPARVVGPSYDPRFRPVMGCPSRRFPPP